MTVPHLIRSSLHRYLQWHGINRLPEVDGTKLVRAKFEAYPIGYFHVYLADLRTDQSKLYLLAAIDRTSKFAFVELHVKATRRIAGNFLWHLAAAVPYQIFSVLTDNRVVSEVEGGTHFTDPTTDSRTPGDINEKSARKLPLLCQAFEGACADLDIEHRLTKPRHPSTNGQVEWMNRTVKEAAVKCYRYEKHDQLRKHLINFVAAYNCARSLKTLRALRPYEAICKVWADDPSRFVSNPHHQTVGPDI